MLKCQVSWPRAWMSSQLAASYVVQTVGRVQKRAVICIYRKCYKHKKNLILKMDSVGSKKKYYSLKMNNITAIDLKVLPNSVVLKVAINSEKLS